MYRGILLFVFSSYDHNDIDKLNQTNVTFFTIWQNIFLGRETIMIICKNKNIKRNNSIKRKTLIFIKQICRRKYLTLVKV